MKKKHVLIVEDEVALNEAYQTILASADYKLSTAYDGEEALEKTAKEDPDIILLDLRMPRMDGIGFLKKYQPIKKRPKILVFSNYDMQKEIDEAYELGADKYILKAWASPKELLQIVKNLLEEKE